MCQNGKGRLTQHHVGCHAEARVFGRVAGVIEWVRADGLFAGIRYRGDRVFTARESEITSLQHPDGSVEQQAG